MLINSTAENPLAADLDIIIEHTRLLWEELRGQQIFMSGGTGFFGSWLLESFAWANDRLNLNAKMLVLSRNPAAFKQKAPHLASHPMIEFFNGDVRTFEFPPGQFPFIIHAAADTNHWRTRENSIEILDTIFNGTKRVLDFASLSGCQKILLLSSGAIYGEQPANLTKIPEDYQGAPAITNPLSAYGEGKRLSELLGTLYARDYPIEVKIARCFSFLGPYMPYSASFAVGNFIQEAIITKHITINGDGTPLRSYLYAADLTIWLWTILINGENSRPYNVGSSEEISIFRLAELIAQRFNPQPQITRMKTPSGNDAERYIPSIARASLELNLYPRTALYDGIDKSVFWAIRKSGYYR